MFERLLRFVVSRPRFVIAVTLMVVAGLGWNMQYLEMDPVIRNMLPQDMPEWVNLKDFEETSWHRKPWALSTGCTKPWTN